MNTRNWHSSISPRVSYFAIGISVLFFLMTVYYSSKVLANANDFAVPDLQTALNTPANSQAR